MTGNEFRANKARCAALKRLMEMPIFQLAVEAVFEDLDLTEAFLLNKHLDSPTANVEVRLQNSRKGHTDFINALRLYWNPLETAADEPEPTYGVDEQTAAEASRQMSGAGDPWQQEAVEL